MRWDARGVAAFALGLVADWTRTSRYGSAAREARRTTVPLALVQAGAYIGATNLTVGKYIAHYDKTWDRLMTYQDRYPLQEYAERSVLTTGEMSYEQVRTVKPEAARLLDQWALFHPGDVSYELVEKYTRYFEGSKEARERELLATDELPPGLSRGASAGSEAPVRHKKRDFLS
jgi:hypothetical protein